MFFLLVIGKMNHSFRITKIYCKIIWFRRWVTSSFDVFTGKYFSDYYGTGVIRWTNGQNIYCNKNMFRLSICLARQHA